MTSHLLSHSQSSPFTADVDVSCCSAQLSGTSAKSTNSFSPTRRRSMCTRKRNGEVPHVISLSCRCWLEKPKSHRRFQRLLA